LGDLFLRHGWFESAYRQYKTLVVLQGERPLAHLRLAIAAAGMGKVDEALRIERKVSTFDGEEGADDPRRYARLHSAVRLARMIAESDPEKDADQIAALKGSLKRTQLFTEPTTMVLLTWRDLSVPLALRAKKGNASITVADDADAHQIGLGMLNFGRRDLGDVTLGVHIEQAPIRRDTPFSIVTIVFDGNDFQVREQRATLEARTQMRAI
jgi:hypothetical protein